MSEPVATSFKYVPPEESSRPKSHIKLFRADIVRAAVQVVREGGENNLHAHRSSDGFWMVLAGRVRFYGEGDEVLGEFGKYEGIHIPRMFQYWFESTGDEPLEILHVAANLPDMEGSDRVDMAEQPSWMREKNTVGS